MSRHTTDKDAATKSVVSESRYRGPLGVVREYLDAVKLFSRNIRLYLFGSFLMGLNFHVFVLLLNLYLRDLGFTEGDIGQVLSMRAVGMTIIAIPAAILIARVRLKPILLTASVLFAIFSFFITTAEEFYLLLTFSLLSGMSFAFYRVAGGPFFMRNTGKIERTHVFSMSFGMMVLAGMVGSFFAGRTAELLGSWTGDIVLGYRYTLYLGIAMSLLSLVPFALIKAAKPSAEERQLNVSLGIIKQRWRQYFKITFANFIVGLGAGLIIPFLNLYYRDRFGLTADTIGDYYAILGIGTFTGSIVGPILASRLGLVRTVVMTQLASIPFMLILAHSYVLPLVVVAFVLRGGLMNMGVPITHNLGLELTEEHEHGLVNALLTVAWTSSWMFSAAIGGELIERFGYALTMDITIALYVISSLVYYWFFRNIEYRSSESRRWEIAREDFH